MYCSGLSECYEQIRAYTDRDGTGYPLIVNTENYNDFQEILNRMAADESKECIFVSDHTFANGVPNIPAVIEKITGRGCQVAVGISQSLMLKGERDLDEQLDELLGKSIKDHAIILVSHCRMLLERYQQRDLRLANRILYVSGEKTPLPQIRLASAKDTCSGMHFIDGLKALIRHLEKLSDKEVASKPYLLVVTPFSPAFFGTSMYAISTWGGIYDVIAERYADFASAVLKEYGTEDQWAWLLTEMEDCHSFSSLVVKRFESTSNLAIHIGDILESADEKTIWLYWMALKVFGSRSNHYLTKVLDNSKQFTDFEEHIYMDLLEDRNDDPLFYQYYSERKQLIARMPENLPLTASYCKLAGRHGKKAAYYLTDATETEEFTFMQVVDQYEWQEEELAAVIRRVFPELSLYLREFVFDALNTKLPDKDAGFSDVLTAYFNRYKSQKIRNRIDKDFLEEVDRLAVERPFYKLQPRSIILSGMDKHGTQGFFFDALGVEYLSYIQAKCEQYGMICEVHVAHCELPSITVKNKDFKHYFETKDISELDELKHHSQVYDYQTCPYPIHVFRELEIIDKELRRIRSQLIQHIFEKAVIISDHGASRLAVIYKHESHSPLQLDEKGEHSGRCCPSETDPHIDQAAYEDGYAVLGNYERFKGGRKANLEVHGGASLEEVVIPILVISLRPDNVVYYFVDPVINYKIGQVPNIVLFSNIPMKQPKILVDSVFYEGVFQKDQNHASFAIAEAKRVREYKAAIYDGDVYTGVELTFRVERNTKTKNLFG